MTRMRARLFTDFDGPIMDVSERYYRVYRVCLERVRHPNREVSPLTKEQFWELKRAQVPERDIAIKSGLIAPGESEAFAQLRRDIVHTEPYFQYDRLQANAIATLERAQAAGLELVVVTMRRVRELYPVLQACNLERFFPPDRRYCLADDYTKTGDTNDKPLLMERAIAELPPAEQQWMVGDTEADILAGKRVGVPTIGVLCGIRNETQLQLHNPHRIVEDLAQTVALLLAELAKA